MEMVSIVGSGRLARQEEYMGVLPSQEWNHLLSKLKLFYKILHEYGFFSAVLCGLDIIGTQKYVLLFHFKTTFQQKSRTVYENLFIIILFALKVATPEYESHTGTLVWTHWNQVFCLFIFIDRSCMCFHKTKRRLPTCHLY